jgi:NAD-dependent dihydropyrimidine dehydrogenase PreA subunit
MPIISIAETGCRDCQLCVDICPTKVFERDETKQVARVARQDDCIGCTSCVYLCPSGCLEVSDFVEQRPFHRIEKNTSLVSRFLQKKPVNVQLGAADYDEALVDTHVRLNALADAVAEVLGRGAKSAGRTAGNLSAAHLPEVYEAPSMAQLLDSLRRRFAGTFDFQATASEDGNSITLTFPDCALRRVVARKGEAVGKSGLCDLFHEYWAGLVGAFAGRNYAVEVTTGDGCTMKLQVRV